MNVSEGEVLLTPLLESVPLFKIVSIIYGFFSVYTARQ